MSSWIWPKTFLEFHRPALPAEHWAVLLVARSASGLVFYTLNNSMQQRNFEKLTVPQLAKNLPSLYGRSIATFTRAFHLSLSWARSMQCLSQTNFLEFKFNIILPSMPRSSKSFLSLRFPQQNPICTSPSFMLHVSPISFFFIWSVQFMKLFIIQYNLTKIILQSVADHNCDLRSTAVYFTSAETEATNKTFHWLITFHPNLTCRFLLHTFHYISFVPNFSCALICFVLNFKF